MNDALAYAFGKKALEAGKTISSVQAADPTVDLKAAIACTFGGGRNASDLACETTRLRQVHRHGRAAALDAGDRHLAVMQLDQTLGDGEAEARALRLLDARRLRLMERAEQVQEFRFRNADAGIGNADLH